MFGLVRTSLTATATFKTHFFSYCMIMAEHKRKKRPSLVCDSCKRKKIKCDKESPCNKCIKAGHPESCVFLEATGNDEQIKINQWKKEQLPYVKSAKNHIGLSLRHSELNITDPAMTVQQFTLNFHSVRDTKRAKVSHASKPTEASLLVSRSEIEFLKNRLKEIESTLGKVAANSDSANASSSSLSAPTPRLFSFLLQTYPAGVPPSTNRVTSPRTRPGLASVPAPVPVPAQYVSENHGQGALSPGYRPLLFLEYQPIIARDSPSLYSPGGSSNVNGGYWGPISSTSKSYDSSTATFSGTFSNPSIQLPPLRMLTQQQQQLQKLEQLAKESQTQYQQREPNPGHAQKVYEHMFEPNKQYISSKLYYTDYKKPNGGEVQFFSDMCQSTDISQLIGINPYRNTGERINLFEGYTSIHVKEPTRQINYGPLAWSSLMKRDYGLSLLWDYMIEQKTGSKEKNGPLLFGTVTSEMSQENADVLTNEAKDESENAFEKRALETDGFGDILPYEKLINKEKNSKNKGKNTLNSSFKSGNHKNNQATKNATKNNNESTNTPISAAPSAHSYGKLDIMLDKTFITGLSMDSSKSNSNGALSITVADGNLSRELQLIHRIQKLLPKKKVVYKLLDMYFDCVYPYIPFADEECTRHNLALVLGPPSYEDTKFEQIKIKRRLDLAYIGILLVILRLVYLSLFSNKTSVNRENLLSEDPSPEAQDLKYLFSNPITTEMIEVAQGCLDLFQLFRKTNMTILLLALFIRVYRSCAPEDGDGSDGGDLQVFGAMLLQMAYSLGLHREPDKFSDVSNNPKLNHLGRKIFQYLVMADVHQAYTHGNPISVDTSSHDVRKPFYDLKSCNIKDKEMDKVVTENIANCASILALSDILKKLLNAKDGCNISEICAELGTFEVSMQNYIGDVEVCFDSATMSDSKVEKFKKNFRIKFLISIYGFFMSVYFYFYLYFEHKCNDLSFYYLKKMLLMAKVVLEHYFDLLGNKNSFFDLMINPTLQQFIHKANLLIMALIIRVNFTLYDLVRKDNHQSRYEDPNDKSYRSFFDEAFKMSRYLKRNAEISISAISKISNRYYYAWRITKSHTFLLKTITSSQFYEDNYSKAERLCCPIYCPQQVKVMNQIMKDSIRNYDFVEVLTPDFCPFLSNPPLAPKLPYNLRPNDGILDFGGNFINNSEIDLLWFQIISQKYDSSQDPNTAPIGNISQDYMGINPNHNPTPSSTTNSTTSASSNINIHSTFDRANCSTKETKNINNKINGNGMYGNGLNGIGNGGINANGGNQANNNFNGGGPDIRHGFDIEEMIRFDIFNDLPLDQLFANSQM